MKPCCLDLVWKALCLALFIGMQTAAASVPTHASLSNPWVTLTAPANNSTITEGYLTLSATAGDSDGSITKVSFYYHGEVVEDYTAPYSVTIQALAGDEGPVYREVYARAMDNDGLYGYSDEAEILVTPPPCELLTHSDQYNNTLCQGDSGWLKSRAAEDATTIQWIKKVGAGAWQAIAGATAITYQTKSAGYYAAVWQFSGSAACTTAVDTVVILPAPTLETEPIYHNPGGRVVGIAHGSGGTPPHQFYWGANDTCMSGYCDTAVIGEPDEPVIVTVQDANGCMGETDTTFVLSLPLCKNTDKNIAAQGCNTGYYGWELKPLEEAELGSRSVINSYLTDSVAFCSLPSTLHIPIVFGVIDSTGGTAISDSTTDERLKANLSTLNYLFGRNPLTHFGQTKVIQFCMPSKLPGTNTSFSGIRRFTSNTLHIDSGRNSGWAYRANLVLGDFDPSRYLRVLIYKRGIANGATPFDLISYCTDFKIKDDAVWIDYKLIGDTSHLYGDDQGTILAHEVGHWLGLLHTFQRYDYAVTDPGGSMIAGQNQNLLFNASTGNATWDFLIDTPPQKSYWRIAGQSYAVVNSDATCQTLFKNNLNGKLFGPGPWPSGYTSADSLVSFTNIMDYSPDYCRKNFTRGQRERMFSYLLYYRKNLFSPENLAYTSVSPFNNVPVSSFTLNRKSNCGTDSVFKLTILGNPDLDTVAYGIKIYRKGATETEVHSTTVSMGSLLKKTVALSNSIFNPKGLFRIELTATHPTADSNYVNISNSDVFYDSNCPSLDSSRNYLYFGQYAGLLFDAKNQMKPDSAAYHSTPANRRQRSQGGNVTINDSSGNLLFYASARGLWNNSHVRQYNQFYSDARSAQYGVAVKGPGSGEYILYTVPSRSGGFYNKGLRAHRFTVSGGTIDTSTTANWNQPIKKRPSNALYGADSSLLVSDKITCIPKCGGDGDWLLVQKPWANTGADSFYVYSLDSGKIKTKPAVYPAKNRSKTGFLKSSPTGNWLVSTYNDTLNAATGYGTGKSTWVFRFVAESGVIVPYAKLSIAGTTDSASAYGAAFSPDSRQAYVAVNTQKKVGGKPLSGIYRFSLSDTSSQAIEGVRVASIPPYCSPSVDISRGADGKLYLSNPPNEGQQVRSRHWPNPPFNKELGVIHFPNDAENPGITWDGPTVVANTSDTIKSGRSLPNFVDAKVKVMPDSGLVESDPWRLGTNPASCCPVPYVMDVACTGDDDTTVISNDIFYELTMTKISGAFKDLVVSSVYSEFPTTIQVNIYRPSDTVTVGGDPAASGNGQWVVVSSEDIKARIGTGPTTAKIQIIVNANSVNASGLFKTKIYTQFPDSHENPAICCRLAVDGMSEEPIYSRPVNKTSAKADWKIYPNPAGNQLYVETEEEGQLGILDQLGRKVVEALKVQDKMSIPILGLPSGIYQVKLTPSSRVSTLTLSIQK